MDSVLFQTLTEEELRAVALRYFGEELWGWELLRGGLFNTTYRLDMEGRSVILRLGPVHRELLLPYERYLMASEPLIQELMNGHGIPTSNTLMLDLGRDLLDRDIAVVERIYGVSLSALGPDPVREGEICRKAGALTRTIHSLTAFDLPVPPAQPFGRTSLVLNGQGSDSWREAMLSELGQWADRAKAVTLLPEELILRCIRCFVALSSVFDDITEPVLVHGDLWYGNLLVDEKGELQAIIDNDRSFFGDPDFDLMLPWMPAEPFMEGYGGLQDMSDRAVLRRKLYRFLLLLEDTYILKVEYRDPEGYLRSKADVYSCLTELERYV